MWVTDESGDLVNLAQFDLVVKNGRSNHTGDTHWVEARKRSYGTEDNTPDIDDDAVSSQLFFSLSEEECYAYMDILTERMIAAGVPVISISKEDVQASRRVGGVAGR